jgi:hypothetical protein
LVRLAIGTRGWYDEAAVTQSRGIATAALSRAGHAIAVFLGIVVVVVVVGIVVVEVDVEVVVVAVVVVVVTTVVVDETVVVVVVVVVVGGVDEAHALGTVVVVVGDNAGLSWAAVGVADVAMTNALSAIDKSAPRPNQWSARRVTQ